MVEDGKGGHLFAVDGLHLFPIGLAGAAGKPSSELKVLGNKAAELRVGGWDPVARLEDMEADGIVAEVLYPSVGMTLAQSKDLDYQLACVRAYNDWLLSYCAGGQGRLVGLAIIPTASVEAAVEEISRVAVMARRSGVDGTAATAIHVLRQMRRDIERPQHVDQAVRVVGLVSADRASARMALPARVQHQHRRVALGGAVRRRGHRVHDEPMAVLDEQMPEVRQPRLPIRGLAIQLGVGVRRRRMRHIRAALAVKVRGPAVGRWPVLRLKTLLTRPGLDQGAIDREMFVGHIRLRPLHHAITSFSRRSRFFVKTVGVHTASSIVSPTNQRKRMLYSSCSISSRSLRIE